MSRLGQVDLFKLHGVLGLDHGEEKEGGDGGRGKMKIVGGEWGEVGVELIGGEMV